MKLRNRHERLTHILLFLISCTGMGVLALSTRHGIGIGGDATIYIFSARNLLDGHGLGLLGPDGVFRLIPYFPPFYSLVLAFFGFFGANMAVSAYWLNLFLFFGLIWLTGEILFHATRSPCVSLCGALLLLASPVLVPVFSWAMSEPLALMLGFSGLALLIMYAEKPEQKWVFFTSAVLVGLAFLTRYPAAIFLGVGGICAVSFSRGRWLERFWRGALYFLIGILPMAAWVVYDFATTDTVASRSVETAAGMAQRFVSLWPKLRDVFLFWMIPDSWISTPPYPGWLNTFGLMIGILMVLGSVVLVGRYLLINKGKGVDGKEGERIGPLLMCYVGDDLVRSCRWVFVLVIFILGYLAMIALVYIVTFPPITIGSRMLSPVHVAVIWLLPLLAGLSFAFWPKKRWLKIGFLLLGVIFLMWYGLRITRIVGQNYRFGQGYHAPMWQGSEVIRAVRDLPMSVPVVTNDQTAVLYLTGRSAYAFAEIYRNDALEVFSRYGEGEIADDQGQDVFRNESAVLVLFDSITEQMETIYADRAIERVERLVDGLEVDFEGNDGAIYSYPLANE